MVSTCRRTARSTRWTSTGWAGTRQGTNPNGSSCAPSCGGRLMLHVGPLSGVATGRPARRSRRRTTRTSGMTECNWTPSYTLNVPSDVDERHLPRQAQARRRTAARELHDLRRPRRREHRGCPVFARCDDLEGLQLLGRLGQQQRRLQPLRPLQRHHGGQHGQPRASRSRSTARTRTARSTTAPASSSTGTTR